MKEKLRMLFDEKLWKFLLVGVLNTLVGNGLMFLLYNLAGFSYWPATGLSYALASVMSYFLNRYFTFKYQGSGWGTALRFALNIAVCYGLAYGLAKPLVRLIFSGLSKKWAENLAMLAGMGLFVVFNYFGQRFFCLPREEGGVRNAGGGSQQIPGHSRRSHALCRGGTCPSRRCTVDLCRLSLK
ncbi:MAG: GtrA family protein [Oscillospiraceae bacterium]